MAGGAAFSRPAAASHFVYRFRIGLGNTLLNFVRGYLQAVAEKTAAWCNLRSRGGCNTLNLVSGYC